MSLIVAGRDSCNRDLYSFKTMCLLEGVGWMLPVRERTVKGLNKKKKGKRKNASREKEGWMERKEGKERRMDGWMDGCAIRGTRCCLLSKNEKWAMKFGF